MAEHGIIGGAFVQIRPELTQFRREVQFGVRQTFRELGTLHVPGLERTERDLNSLGAAARRAGQAERLSLAQIRTSREQEARDTVASSIVKKRALQEEVVAYRAVAASAVAGSATQVEANRLAALSAQQLGAQLTAVEAHSIGAAATINRLERGAIAGSGAIGGMGRSVAFASLSFIGAYGLVHSIRSALEEAGDLNTQTARSVTVFDASAGAIQRWSKDATRDLGYAKESALAAANSFGTIFGAAGIRSRQQVQFSEDLTRVAAALSLARGEADPQRAEQAIRVALAGRGRALRQYGVILDDTSLKAKAAELDLLKITVDPERVVLAQRKLAEATIALGEARQKGTVLQQAKAEDAVTAAQLKLRTELAGTTGELDRQQKAVAAHAIIMEQGQRFVDRYGASLDTAAGRSRRFHEGVSEIKEELGTALYPSFAQATDGITGYIRSISEGGPRHEEFTRDLHDAAEGAHALYAGLRILGTGFLFVSHAVGGIGNLVEILALGYATNKALVFAAGIRESRLALFVLGETATVTGAKVVASEAEMAAGASTLSGRLGILAGKFGRLAAIGTIVIGLDLVINKGHRDDFRHFLNEKTVDARNFVHDNLGPLGFLAPEIKPGDKDSAPFGGRPAHAPKTQGEASSRAKQLRGQNLGEELIYRTLRSEGYTRRLAVQAIVTTREHPGGAVLPPSPEDLRSAPGSPASRGSTATQRSTAATQIRTQLGLLAKEIESGEQITRARAAKLGQALANVAVEISSAGFGPTRRQALTGEVEKLATELASATAGIGSQAVAALKKDRADIRTQLNEIGADIAQARVDMASAIGDAIKSAAEAERNAVAQAKSNLNSLGQSLSDFIGRFVDAQDERAQATPTGGPLAERLKRLTELIRAGQATPELVREAERVEHELNEQSRRTGEDSTKRKERITRGLADLTDQLNTGKISLAKFNREVTQLLRKEGISYKAAGKVLGIAFADGFRVALHELREQAAALLATPAKLRRVGTGFESGVVKPAEVVREQTANIARVTREQNERLRELIARRHTLLLKEQQDSNAIARAQRARTNALLSLKPPKPEAPKRPERPEAPAAPPRRRTGGTELVGHGPDPLGDIKRVQSVRLKVDVQANERDTKREVNRLRDFIPPNISLGLRLERKQGDQARARGIAYASGVGLGQALSQGIGVGIGARVQDVASAAVLAIRHAVAAAKKAAKIGSPSELTRDEIGVPLGEGIRVAIEGVGETLGDDLAAEIRRAVVRGRKEATERQRGLQRPVAPDDRTAFPKDEPPRGATPGPDRRRPRETPERTAVAVKGRVLERPDSRAGEQRGLLLTEERRHTRLLERILVQDTRTNSILARVEKDVRPAARPHPDKNPKRATEAGHAAARNNLLD